LFKEPLPRPLELGGGGKKFIPSKTFSKTLKNLTKYYLLLSKDIRIGQIFIGTI
jgi:hypothetical protein